MALWKRLARALNFRSGPKSASEWERVWSARQAGLEQVLGTAESNLYHAPIPLHIGGSADVLVFRGADHSYIYVTADLTGQEILGAPPGEYELMICTRYEAPWAASLIARLARYCLDNVLAAGHTMQIAEDAADDALYGLVFTTADPPRDQFAMLGKTYQLLLAIGVTKSDLDVAMHDGTEVVLEALRARGTFPYTNVAPTGA